MKKLKPNFQTDGYLKVDICDRKGNHYLIRLPDGESFSLPPKIWVKKEKVKIVPIKDK